MELGNDGLGPKLPFDFAVPPTALLRIRATLKHNISEMRFSRKAMCSDAGVQMTLAHNEGNPKISC
jgi:hypothetical protein